MLNMNVIGGLLISKLEEFLLKKTGENILSDINHPVTVEILKRNLKLLSDRALDIEHKIRDAEQSGHKKRKREVETWLQEVKKLGDEIGTFEGEAQSDGFVSRFLGGDRATQLKERVVELVEQSTHFGELVLEAPKTKGEEWPTTNLVGKEFEENLKRIWKFLTVDDVKIIGIYGMGGVGKTTLTKHINNQLLKETEESVFWVTVSQESSIRMLQDKIAHLVGVNLLDDDEDKRAAILYRAISSLRKKFVLILDDVWKNINLEKLGIQLHMQGSKVIITTRSSQVCHQIGCQKMIPVKTLDTNEGWELFKGTLGQEVTLTPQVEEIAKRVTKECGGLPLGIITLAGSMRGETAIHAWRNVLEEVKESVMMHDEMEDHVFKVLKYSFDRLNPKHQEQGERNRDYTELQCCFLYCSLYPEDFEIPKEDLVRKFISEELVGKRKSRGAQVDLAHTILDKLVKVCLLERSVVIGCVKMHDLVRVMALKISHIKNMVLAGCQLRQIPNEDEFWTKDVEKMSLMHNDIMEIPDGMSPNCPKLSTLLLQGNLSLKFIADKFFSQMHGLCVLDLSNSGVITKLPNSLSDLGSLKSLILKYCSKLVGVPYLGKLKALKELDLSDIAIREVPQGMDELVNLKFLSMDDARNLEILPAGLVSKFQNLQCLHLPRHIETPIIEMESLRKLEEFKGRLDDVAAFNRLIACRQGIRYDITVGSFTPYMLMGYYGVHVVGCNYLMEDAAMMAHDAHHLGLSDCEGLSKSLLDDFPKFSNPKSLQTLEIFNCGGIECILAKKEEIESHYIALLGTIDTIKLWSLPDFMGMIQKQEVVLPTPTQAVFSSVRELTISDCPKMKNLGLTGSEFPNLESINLGYCSEIEEIIEQGGVVSFPKLKRLDLQHLPKLRNVGTTTICNSIETIVISECGALKKVPLYFPVRVSVSDGGESSNVSYSPPPALKTISLLKREEEIEWWESLEWDHPSHKLLLKPFLSFF